MKGKKARRETKGSMKTTQKETHPSFQQRIDTTSIKKASNDKTGRKYLPSKVATIVEPITTTKKD